MRQTWLEKWAAKVGLQEAADFQAFLQLCPPEIQNNLAREPLLLYLLAIMHREKRLNVQMFAEAKGIQARICIYDESVRWVLDKHRKDVNLQVTGLESDDLRQFMTEAALCVVQSGNESAPVAMLEARLEEGTDRIAVLIQRARQHTSPENVKPQKGLNNLLTAFYIKPASGDRSGSVEFTHKSFGEFLFAERLVKSFLDWTRKVQQNRRQEYLVSTEVMDKQIYDLLGYGSLTPEIVDYLRGLWAENSELDLVRLFERLQDFYLRWCDGEFIDAPPESLPYCKMQLLQEQLRERENHLGLRQVDVYTGLNVMILLLELNRYAKTKDELKDKIIFYPCGEPDTKEFDPERLLRIIGYSQCLGFSAFRRFLKVFLIQSDLSGVNLSGADLSGVNLSGANLTKANLRGANCFRSDLSGANLSGANLNGTNLLRAKLSQANFMGANLRAAHLLGANLIGANLSQADLDQAYLRDADLSLADLSQADLTRANLSRANLKRANLSGVNLIGADLWAANFSEANLKDIKWDSGTWWGNAKGLHEAVVPPELAQDPAFAAAVASSHR